MATSAAILGLAGPTLTPAERAFFTRTAPWGVILFARNCETPEQLRRLTAELRDAVGRDAPILIDQEGGRVARLTPPVWRGWRPALEQMARAAPGLAVRGMYLRYRLIAAELRDLGIDVNCAPLADVVRPDTHAVLANRCYGDTPTAVITAARAVAQGLLDGGVLPVLKHIPGHGRGLSDSHLELPSVTAPLSELRDVDFAAFQGLADLPLGMTAHIVFTALDPGRPATLSPEMLGLVRREMGFDGLLMTDDLSMQALAGPMAARTTAALAAGCDLVLHCNGDAQEMAEVMEVVGPLSTEAQRRADRALTWRRAPDPVDLAALDAELADILA